MKQYFSDLTDQSFFSGLEVCMNKCLIVMMVQQVLQKVITVEVQFMVLSQQFLSQAPSWPATWGTTQQGIIEKVLSACEEMHS